MHVCLPAIGNSYRKHNADVDESRRTRYCGKVERSPVCGSGHPLLYSTKPYQRQSKSVWLYVWRAGIPVCMVEKIANRDVCRAQCATPRRARTQEQSHMLCIRPDRSGPVMRRRPDAFMRSVQCAQRETRTVNFSCLTQLAEGSNLAQTVSVGCCRC